MNELKKETQIESSFSVKPFIRWAGGKQNLVQKLSEKVIHERINNYFEPFLGAGSLFFHNDFQSGYLSDINPHLINAYLKIKENAFEVFERLEFHKKRHSKEYYYKIREIFNNKRLIFDFDQAVNFIFLVHTSFNGIYRVNQKGEYNVPFGKINPALPSLEHLLKIQTKLQKVEIENVMYEDNLRKIKEKDFVYFDPPYPPLNKTSYFQHYSVDKFSAMKQAELSDYAKEISNKGAFVMISNAETPEILQLYKSWNIESISTYRFVNCKSARGSVNELIITNY